MRMRENSSKPVWADDDWLSSFAGKQVKLCFKPHVTFQVFGRALFVDHKLKIFQALEQQQKDNPVAGAGQEEPEAPKAKRPAESAAAEGQVMNNPFRNMLQLVFFQISDSKLANFLSWSFKNLIILFSPI